MFDAHEQERTRRQSQDLNMPFLSTAEIVPSNGSYAYIQRIQDWQLSDDPVDSVELDEKIESRLNDIDSGKEKLTRYSNAKEYLKHVDELLE